MAVSAPYFRLFAEVAPFDGPTRPSIQRVPEVDPLPFFLWTGGQVVLLNVVDSRLGIPVDPGNHRRFKPQRPSP